MNADSLIAELQIPPADTSPNCDGKLTDSPGARAASVEVVTPPVDLEEFKRSLFAAFDRQTAKAKQAPRQFSSQARFTRRRRIGGGGLGDVYEAIDRKVGRIVAVKISKSASSWTRCEDDRFYREYRLTARLQHPGIPAVYSAGRLSNGRRFYSMRRVAGQTLTALIRNQRRASTTGEEVAHRTALLTLLAPLKDVCDTVQAAHQAGFLHLDLKPDNVMVEPSGATFVVDWGLAQPFTVKAIETQIDSSSVEEAERGPLSVAGTFEYMPPEQLAGRSAEFDARTDVFALSGILHVILTGSPPRTRSRQTKGTRLWSLIRKGTFSDSDSEIGQELDAGVPAELASICRRGLAARQADRYASALELREDIERWERGENVVAHQHKYRLTERVSRWVARHAKVVVPAAIIGLMLVLSWSFVAVSRAHADREKGARQATNKVALGILQQNVESVQNEDLLRRPELLPLRLKFLQNAWMQYDQWATRSVDDTGMMIQMVYQLHRVADAYDETVSEQQLLTANAELRVAETAIERATEVCQRLVARPERTTDDHVLLASSYRRGAALDAKRGDSESALAKAALASETLGKIGTEGTEQTLESVRVLRLIATVHYHRAMSAPTDPLRHELLQIATDQAERMLQAAGPLGTEGESGIERVQAESLTAIIDHKFSRHAAAVRHYEQALTLLNTAEAAPPVDGKFNPDWVRRTRMHAQIRNNYGMTLRGMENSPASLQSHRRAKELRKQVVDLYPWLLAVRSELAQSHGNIADTLIDFGDARAEIAERREATQLLQRTFEDYPSLPGVKEFWALHRVRAIAALHRLGQDEQAAQEFIETLQVCPAPELAEKTNVQYLLDVTLGHCLALQAGSEPDERRQAAIRLVLRCHEINGFDSPINRQHFLTESAFEWLRNADEIKTALDEVLSQ